MKFSLHMPLGVIAPGEFQSIEAIVEIAQALEGAGVDAGCVTDHPAPHDEWLHASGHDALDPFAALSFVAAVSSKLLVHTHVTVLPYRNPFITAKAATTLQALSGGRLILGVGAGYQKAEFEALGVNFHERGALTDEALETILLIWAGGTVKKKGFHFDAVGNEPRPTPDPRPPIWIGGNSEKALERAARWGDGWAPFFGAPTQSATNQRTAIQSVAHLGEKLETLRRLRAELDRADDFDVVVERQLRINELSSAEARRLLDVISELAEVGVTWTVVDPGHASREAYLDNVRWFGSEIVPHAPVSAGQGPSFAV